MASPPVLKFDLLLQPISDDAPAGADVRSDPKASQLYYAVKDARSSARSKERSSLAEDGEAPDLPGEWRPVFKQAHELLAHHSKDLEITAWLIEASVRLDGFAGLRDGFRLARELIGRFWDPIYPHPDEDGIETTVAPLAGLNGEDGEGTLIAPIRAALITGGQSVGPFATWNYEQAVALEQITDPKKRERRIDAGAVTLRMIQQAAAETAAQEFVRLHEDLQGAQAEFQQLSAALDERCGNESPPSSNIRHALEACQEALTFLAGDKLRPISAGEPTDASGGDGAAPAAAGIATTPGQIRNREDAFKVMLDIADFFRRTEPHSLLSYSLEQVVRWGKTPLPQLLSDLIGDKSAREELFRLTGIPILKE